MLTKIRKPAVLRKAAAMAARSKARKRALDILFEAELRGLPTLGLLSERQSVGDVPVAPYAAGLVRGVATHSDRIDALISWNLVDWTLERMPAVDRNILRIGVYEILWADDVPDSVAISEAVALAQDLSTDNSPSFVNGVLARIKADKPTISLDPELAPSPHPDDPDYAAADEDEDDEDFGDEDPFEDGESADEAPPAGPPGAPASRDTSRARPPRS
jgi:N utilization substance protein B